ncbi:hypothetical protein HID58_092571 [Brassica napus]|uniref:Uncharacterized protein n=1 Tax=Brassica napus TaxID=3708 RepID=A0ABQ7WW44_BRANA|nr:hypothetical protein HID58_092571 [Brassica napus]
MAPSRILEQRGSTNMLRPGSRRSRLSCRNKIRKVHGPAVHPDQRDKFAIWQICSDMMIETTPNINRLLPLGGQSLHLSFIPEPTPEEQAYLERRADEHSSDLFDEINLNTIL